MDAKPRKKKKGPSEAPNCLPPPARGLPPNMTWSRSGTLVAISLSDNFSYEFTPETLQTYLRTQALLERLWRKGQTFDPERHPLPAGFL